MKQQNAKLTLHETEQLCRLYMDCNLSVFEETELRYVLTKVDYHSPLIDETRQIMEIESGISNKPVVEAGYNRKRSFHKWGAYVSIAASIAIVIGIGLPLWRTSAKDAVEPQSYYIAYVNGHRLNDEAARLQIEAGKKAAEDFIKEMSELEESKQQMIEKFFNP